MGQETVNATLHPTLHTNQTIETHNVPQTQGNEWVLSDTEKKKVRALFAKNKNTPIKIVLKPTQNEKEQRNLNRVYIMILAHGSVWMKLYDSRGRGTDVQILRIPVGDKQKEDNGIFQIHFWDHIFRFDVIRLEFLLHWFRFLRNPHALHLQCMSEEDSELKWYITGNEIRGEKPEILFIQTASLSVNDLTTLLSVKRIRVLLLVVLVQSEQEAETLRTIPCRKNLKFAVVSLKSNHPSDTRIFSRRAEFWNDIFVSLAREEGFSALKNSIRVTTPVAPLTTTQLLPAHLVRLEEPLETSRGTSNSRLSDGTKRTAGVE